MPTTLSLVGSTGSIGTQAVDVIRAAPDRYRVVAIGAHRSVKELAAQAVELRPQQVAIADSSLAGQLAEALPPGIEVLAGPEAMAAITGRPAKPTTPLTTVSAVSAMAAMASG
ncbi:MAG: 1-deoxy-D-xylulose-5-phosphate reductoisomerase, partial [Acidimicrobiales bacterium]